MPRALKSSPTMSAACRNSSPAQSCIFDAFCRCRRVSSPVVLRQSRRFLAVAALRVCIDSTSRNRTNRLPVRGVTVIESQNRQLPLVRRLATPYDARHILTALLLVGLVYVCSFVPMTAGSTTSCIYHSIAPSKPPYHEPFGVNFLIPGTSL